MNILLMGSAGVGKSTWLNKLYKYEDKNKLDNKLNYIIYNDKNFNIIEINNFNTTIVNRDYDAVIIMCDLDGHDLEEVKKYRMILNTNKNLFKKYTISPILLVINKLDIDVEKDIDFENFSKDHDFYNFVGISALTDYDTVEPLNKIIEIIDQKIVKNNVIIDFIYQLIISIKTDSIFNFKISYLALIYDPQFFLNKDLEPIINDINKLMIDNDINVILNYLIEFHQTF